MTKVIYFASDRAWFVHLYGENSRALMSGLSTKQGADYRLYRLPNNALSHGTMPIFDLARYGVFHANDHRATNTVSYTIKIKH